MANNYEYIEKWQKENYRRITVKMNKVTEKEILDYLEQSGNMQGIIKDAIKEYIDKHGKQ